MDYVKLAAQIAPKYGLDPAIFAKQISAESGGRANARSPAGAIGVAQIMPATAKAWGVNPADPVASLHAAARNMAQYVKQYGSYKNALVAYNAGPGRVGGPLPAETQAYVQKILGGSSGPALGRPASAPVARAAGTTAPMVDTGPQRAALISQFLNTKNADPVSFALGIRGLNDQATPSSSQPSLPGAPKVAGATSPVTAIAARANTINAKQLPYQWGGGHQGKVNAATAKPLDCSGAVSAAIGINPKVASQFKSWGAPGPGRSVTIYAKDTHVLMEINGHFWGTSASNPGGGAGWIPRSQISPQYLAGFTARHPPGE